MRFEASDVAEALAGIGSRCRTAAAVRARVRVGLMSPDDRTPRGSLWSPEALERELEVERWAMREAKRLGIAGSNSSTFYQRRLLQRQPQQLEIVA